jgi:hypothetical protein
LTGTRLVAAQGARIILCLCATLDGIIGDDVAVAHIGPPSDLSEARRAAIAFLAQSEKESAPLSASGQ